MKEDVLAGPNTPVGHLRLQPAPFVEPTESLATVARRLRDESVSLAIVGKPRWMVVTERDVVRALAAGRTPEEPVGLVAIRDPVSVPETVKLIDAAALMVTRELRHLVVTADGGTVSGVLSMRDALQLLVRHQQPGRVPGRIRVWR
jgi:signal-transduction protein with cAMP-binding, CBS, and nucleotidyltransferase domain